MENDNNIHLEFNFKLGVFYRSTRVDLWEQLIQWYFNVVNAISVGYLDVLNFCGLGFSFESFNSYKLDLYGFNLKFRMTFDNVAFEWISEAAVGTTNDTTELELWDGFSGGSFKTVIGNCEVLLDIILSVLELNALSWTLTEELLLSNSWLIVSIIILNDYLVNNRELYSYI